MDYYLYGNNRCSIAEISADYAGAQRLYRIVNCLLETTKSVFALVERTYYGDATLSIASIVNLADEIKDVKVADDLFSISFYYRVLKNNDGFTNAFLQFWREYEQPVFFFFTKELEPNSYNSVLENKKISIQEKGTRIFNLAPCYRTFKSVEDDVLWIEKYTELGWGPLRLQTPDARNSDC